MRCEVAILVRPPLIQSTPQGLYCAEGDFHIDPGRPVERAIITHAHSDHVRRGHQAYLCARSGLGLLRHRLGPGARIDPLRFLRKDPYLPRGLVGRKGIKVVNRLIKKSGSSSLSARNHC